MAFTSPQVTLTKLERVVLLAKFLTMSVDLITAVLTTPFRGANGAATADRHIQNTILRGLTRKLTIRELQFIRGTSAGTFNKWRDNHPDQPLSTEVVSDDVKIHWIGDRSTEKVIFLLHGGGYILPLSVGHLKMMTKFRENMLQRGIQVSVACLEYTTSPHAAYPTQVRQAVIAISHLLGAGRSPSSLILFADSAGAHIAVCVTSHILHPHPDVPSLQLSAPISGLCLISPRTSNRTDARSCTVNSNKDTLERATFRRWIDSFKSGSRLSTSEGEAADGPYTNPIDAPIDWWSGLAKQVTTRVFISAGQHECLRDYQVAFAETWKNLPSMDVALLVEPRGIHDSPLMDIDAGRPKTDLMCSIESWLYQSFVGTA